MRIFLHDFGGYAFPFQLSQTLAERGHLVMHAYYGDHQTTPHGVHTMAREKQNLEIRPIALRQVLNKYNFLKRWQQENEYGHAAARALQAFAPDVVLSANTPLDAQKTLLRAAKKAGIPFVFWLQDLLGVAADTILRQKIPVAGALIGKHYLSLDLKLLQNSQAVIAITQDFAPFLASISISKNKIHYIPNWAPVDQIPVLPRKNRWSAARGLDDKFCFLYAGTLSMKHDPHMLLMLARAFEHQPEVRVVVISNGQGADWLKENRAGLSNLMVLPYQPIEDLSYVLATSDVTLTLLEASAGTYSVPSKVLTYLCAGRPLLMAVPADNQASRIVCEHGAGLITAPGDTASFISAAQQCIADAAFRLQAGQNARSLAERLFDNQQITDAFERILTSISRK